MNQSCEPIRLESAADPLKPGDDAPGLVRDGERVQGCPCEQPIDQIGQVSRYPDALLEAARKGPAPYCRLQRPPGGCYPDPSTGELALDVRGERAVRSSNKPEQVVNR